MSRSVGVMDSVRGSMPEWAVEIFAVIALLGDLVVIVPALALLCVANVASTLTRGDQARSVCSDRTVSLLAAVFGGLAFVVLVKGLFALPRPPAEFHAVTASEYGFPSGHTMAATIFWGALASWSTLGSRSVWAAVAGVVIPLVGFSRLALGVHYLVDVVASVALGALYLAIAARFVRDRPARAFGLALGVAMLAVLATNGSGRAVLAFVGTTGAGLGWYVVEQPGVRRRLYAGAGRLRD